MPTAEPTPRPTICLSMIVRDEAHVVEETLASVVGHLDYWVVVDTGSDDGTQELVRSFFADRGIPGELHERPWRDFGHNRSEALELAAGKADYTWVIDADDLVVGSLDLTGLTSDSYDLRYGDGFTYWRTQLFRSSMKWAYEGVLHEYPRCLDGEHTAAHLEGTYHIESRRLGSRSQVADKYQRDIALLLGVLADRPDDPRTVFYLAQSYLDAGDVQAALDAYTRRMELGGWDEEVFYAALQRARCLDRLDRSWEETLTAYLICWQLRPTRAEPLHEIACHYRAADQFDLCHLFAQRAVEIPFPEAERLFVDRAVYDWKARDECAISAFYLGRHEESFQLNVALLADPSLPESERGRIETNRDFSVPFVKVATTSYPEEIVRRLSVPREVGRPDPQVTLTITTCRRLHLFEQTVNSFLNCCTDLALIDRWICIDDGSSDVDRAQMASKYPFFEFIWKTPAEKGHALSMNRLFELVDTPFWLHLEDDWHFFAHLDYVSIALAVLEADPQLGQVLFNRNYAETIADRWIPGGLVYRTGDGVRFVAHVYIPTAGGDFDAYVATLPPGATTNAYWPHYSLRPSLTRTAAVRESGPFDDASDRFEADLAQRYTDLGWRSAFFDGVFCLHSGALTSDRHSPVPNAYDLNQEWQFGRAPRRIQTVQLLPNWTSPEHLCDLWGRQSQGDRRWNGVVLTSDNDADYWVIVNHPPPGATFRPERTIVLQLEPTVGQAGGAGPDHRHYLQVRKHSHYPNALEWHLGLSYSSLATGRIDKTRMLSTVVSGRTEDPGQRLRVAFVHHLEQRGVPIDVFGRDNDQRFINYHGSLPNHDKSAGILPYRYTFAAENNSEVNYFTEKVVDAVLGEALCFYWGCPNLEELIDPLAFIRLPLENPERSRIIVEEAIAGDEWSRRIDVIRSEKRRLLDDEQVMPMIARIVDGHQFLNDLDIEVINLDRRADRWGAFQKATVATAGEEFAARCRRRAATDGRTLTRTPELEHLFRGNDFGFRRGIVGCALSHLAVWREVAAGTRPRLVLEDDTRFIDAVTGRLAEFAGRLGEEWHDFDLAFLGYTRWGSSGDGRPLPTHRAPRLARMDWATYMGGCFAYIVSPRGAQRLVSLAEQEGIRRGIDWFIMVNAQHLNVVRCEPDLAASPLAAHPGIDSDIQGGFDTLD